MARDLIFTRRIFEDCGIRVYQLDPESGGQFQIELVGLDDIQFLYEDEACKTANLIASALRDANINRYS